MYQTRQAAFYESLKNHQIKGHGTIGFGLPVILVSSDNPYLHGGERGVLVIIEQGVLLGVTIAVFHALDETTHQLGAPVEVRNPVFTYAGTFDHRGARERIDAEAAR